jgi:hypothetical protein
MRIGSAVWYALWSHVILAGPVAAQARNVGDGFRDTVEASWTDLTTRCVTPIENPYTAPVARSACAVRGVTPLGVLDDREWSVVRYLRELIVADSAFADTMPLDELVLIARTPGAGRGRVAWHLARDRRDEFLASLTWHDTPRGAFLTLTLCLNGTGGCQDQYLRATSGRWHVVGQAFDADLQARLPAGHRLHKGRRLDLVTLRGSVPVATDLDGNCCPSFEIPFQVRLDGDTLRLESAGPLRRTQ